MTLRHRRGVRAALALVAVAAAASTAACGTLHGVTSPRDEREHAAAERPGDPRPAVDCATDKCVALTFDGGPSRPTPALLDILKEKHVHATFFVQGKGHTDTYPQTVLRMAREGHEIGNHTWSHKNLTTLDEKGITAEIAPVQRDVRAITGHTPTVMRPPQGRTDDAVSGVMKRLGLAQVLWSATASDFATRDTDTIVQRILEQTHRDGIILLHESYGGTVPAVPTIIDTLQKRGYTLVTFSQLLAPAVPRPGVVYRP
ncbi:polysaccharide deacetylase family protein [Streptomyces sp. NPDC046977]|uniref:polysaccharide deacetylase family protein n=1 Tax=Streptomyces sp. NPDC046977 TaxID=3154703 RepID=UPI0033CC1AF1